MPAAALVAWRANSDRFGQRLAQSRRDVCPRNWFMSTPLSPSLRCSGRLADAFALRSAAALVMLASGVHAQSIINLGVLDPSHQFGQSVGVSGNGQHAAANSGVEFFNQMRGFRWSAGGATQDLGNPTNAANVTAMAINWDGSSLAGTSYPATSSCQAFRWTKPSPCSAKGHRMDRRPWRGCCGDRAAHDASARMSGIPATPRRPSRNFRKPSAWQRSS